MSLCHRHLSRSVAASCQLLQPPAGHTGHSCQQRQIYLNFARPHSTAPSPKLLDTASNDTVPSRHYYSSPDSYLNLGCSDIFRACLPSWLTPRSQLIGGGGGLRVFTRGREVGQVLHNNQTPYRWITIQSLTTSLCLGTEPGNSSVPWNCPVP